MTRAAKAIQPKLDLIFAALADATRRAILERLIVGEATVNELVAPFGLSQPTITKHLQVLGEAGLVIRGRNAQFRPVMLNAAELEPVAAWLGQFKASLGLGSMDAYSSAIRLESRKRGKPKAPKL